MISSAAVVPRSALEGGRGTAPTIEGDNTYDKALECVRVEGVREHQAALQAIADANGGNRFSGLPGHDASVDYVVDRLEAAGYDPEVQTWTVNGVPGSKVPGNFTIPAPAGPEGTVGGGGADYGHGTTS